MEKILGKKRWLCMAMLLIALLVPQMAKADCDHSFNSTDASRAVCTKCNHGFFRYTSFRNEIIEPRKASSITGEMGRALTLLSNTNNGEGVIEFDGPIDCIGDSAFYGKQLYENLVVPSTVTRIGKSAFAECTYFTGNLTLPQDLLLIGERAFEHCTFKGSLVIPDHVQSIGKYAFSTNKQMNGTLTIGQQVHYIYEGAFNNCMNLTGALKIPTNVELLGDYCFGGCEKLTSVNINGVYTKIGNGAFYACKGLTGPLDIDGYVASIGKSAFKQCTGLTGQLYIGGHVTEIGDEAFKGCTGISSMLMSSSVKTIGNSAFEGCTGLSGIVQLGSRVEKIGSRAFTGCTGIESVVIDDKVDSIGDWAFSGCKKLKSYGPCYSVKDIGNYAFNNCSALKSACFGDELESIGSHAFYQCSALEGNLVFPGTLKTIGEDAFYGCSSLNGKLDLGSSIEHIGNWAFYECAGFTGSLVFPSTLKTIGLNAFNSSVNFTDIYDYAAQPQEYTSSMLWYGYGNKPLYVQGSSVELYAAAEGWKNFKTITCIPDTHEFTSEVENEAYLKESGTCQGTVYYLKCQHCDAHGDATWAKSGSRGNHNFIANNDGSLECSYCHHPAIEFVTPENMSELGLTDEIDAFIIDDANRLAFFRDYINESDEHITTSAVLLNDIDMSTLCHPAANGENEVSWEPIAKNSEWKGVLYGRGHKITNLYINQPNGSGALIQKADGRGLGVSQFQHFSLQGTVSGATNMALLVSEAHNSSFEKVTTSGSVSATGEGAASLVAFAESVNATECFNEADITASHAVGGFFGTALTNLNLTYCGNVGNITATSEEKEVYDVGGIVGAAETVIMNNCYAAGTMTWTDHTPGMLLGTATDNAECSTSHYLNNGTSPYCHFDNWVIADRFIANTFEASDLASGALAYRLQNSSWSEVWGQDLAQQQAYPVPGAPQVYPSALSCNGSVPNDATYSNTNNTTAAEHNFVGGTCTVCGTEDIDIIMPASGAISKTLADGKEYNFYDDGGAEGNYSDKAKGTVHFTAPEGYALVFEGIVMGDSNDKLTIDGKVYAASDEGTLVKQMVTNSPCDVKFTSNDSDNGVGFVLTIKSVPFLTDITYEVTPNEDGTTSNVTLHYTNRMYLEFTVCENEQQIATISPWENETSLTIESVESGLHTYTINDSWGDSYTLTVDATIVVHNFENGVCTDCGACEALVTTGKHNFVEKEDGTHHCSNCNARPEIFTLTYANKAVEMEEGFAKRITIEGQEAAQTMTLSSGQDSEEGAIYYAPVNADSHAPFGKTALSDESTHAMYVASGDYEVTVSREGNLVYLTFFAHKAPKGDFNNSGTVTTYDLAQLISHINSGDAKYDMDGNGVINQKDVNAIVAIILENPGYGQGEGYAATKMDFQHLNLPFEYWRTADAIGIVGENINSQIDFAGGDNASATGFYPYLGYAPDNYMAIYPYQDTYQVEEGSGSVLTDEDMMILMQAIEMEMEDILLMYFGTMEGDNVDERRMIMMEAYYTHMMPTPGGVSTKDYPCYADGAIKGYKVPNVQQINAEGYDPSASIMVAEGNDDKDLKFKAAVGYIKVNITSSDVTSLLLNAPEGSYIAGTVDITMQNGTPVCTAQEGNGTNTITANITEGNKVVYIAVIPQTLPYISLWSSETGNANYYNITIAPGQVIELNY